MLVEPFMGDVTRVPAARAAPSLQALHSLGLLAALGKKSLLTNASNGRTSPELADFLCQLSHCHVVSEAQPFAKLFSFPPEILSKPQRLYLLVCTYIQSPFIDVYLWKGGQVGISPI